ncbi:DUF488 domain-containing protein [Desulfobulbus oligotrophicus]|jgi:uncharacterized protein YeaO (DUF488 family)|uniref:DUF488 family protein n=1 Tax=Desulfobulbus oligotrophicus TaxID=1909699 RepID=A0A7T6ARN4_9BACT|nr:DUF488 family protein [Desulfobulbus oligotrophicus]MDY0390688.1 DUF488 family protein [Desulfobulbus oligotrophicus]QQG66738.1 DUF488 family protein [Desulfobulbus oligotrophicus]
MPSITIKRVYDSTDTSEGVRVLVDRVWPRGVSKQKLQAEHWLRDAAPSSALRKWFDHDPKRWDEFKHRYWEELQGKPETVSFLLTLAQEQGLTLLFSARDVRYNQAVALQEYLLARLHTTSERS